MSRPPDEFGIDELRKAAAIFSHCNETFNQRFTTEELLNIARAHVASEWDFLPDTWHEQQIADALRDGTAPRWDAEGLPILGGIWAGCEKPTDPVAIASAMAGEFDHRSVGSGGGDEKIYLTEPLLKVLRAIVYSGAEVVAGMSTATFSEHVEELIRRGALARGPHVFVTDDGLAALRESEAEAAAAHDPKGGAS